MTEQQKQYQLLIGKSARGPVAYFVPAGEKLETSEHVGSLELGLKPRTEAELNISLHNVLGRQIDRSEIVVTPELLVQLLAALAKDLDETSA
jgi:hypothetical protein